MKCFNILQLHLTVQFLPQSRRRLVQHATVLAVASEHTDVSVTQTYIALAAIVQHAAVLAVASEHTDMSATQTYIALAAICHLV